jgi:hypothetical protein
MLPSTTGVVPLGVIVAPFGLVTQIGDDRLTGHPLVFVKLSLVVGGVGLGAGGVGQFMLWGSCVIPSDTVVVDPLSAVTLPAAQLPTPERGVERLPATFALPPMVRLPLVPTLPPYASGVGVPLPG